MENLKQASGEFKHSNDPRNLLGKSFAIIVALPFFFFFSAQAFYGNYSTLDSYTNTVKDGVENRDKAYQNITENCARHCLMVGRQLT